MSTKCITFYSYKGGSGRSTTAVNTIRALIEKMGASAKHPILLVDADVESAGLTFFFNQNDKFCEEYTHCGAFHTTHVLNVSEVTALPFERTRPEPRIAAPSDFLRCFSDEDCFGDNRLADDTPVSAEELFEDVKLPVKEWKMLHGIMDTYIKSKRLKGKTLRYDPRGFVDKLNAIHSSEDRSPEKKEKCIHDFIPARAFTDISEFFGCEPGTVRFLGVDVNYKDEQIARNSTAVPQITNLIEECDKRNYAAVVFDSGAGTQSTAHAFHQLSDVLVYCMRPSSQFIVGTKNNLNEYEGILQKSREEHKESKDTKNVIILPTAVPRNTDLVNLSKDSFSKIEAIATIHKSLVDKYFCSAEKALCEVELFKFKEHILGVPPSESMKLSLEIKSILNRYSDPFSKDFPEDARAAYETYNMLAERIIENCEA